jgi:metal-responsive CopG/Arc/MetJ family transcriptional regulator
LIHEERKLSGKNRVLIPKGIADEIERIRADLGYSTFSEFIHEATRRLLEKEERRFEERELERKTGREVLGKDD